jgi:hypothetical protein
MPSTTIRIPGKVGTTSAAIKARREAAVKTAFDIVTAMPPSQVNHVVHLIASPQPKPRPASVGNLGKRMQTARLA